MVFCSVPWFSHMRSYSWSDGWFGSVSRDGSISRGWSGSEFRDGSGSGFRSRFVSLSGSVSWSGGV